MIDASTRTRLDHHIVAAQALRYRTIGRGLFEITPDWLRGYSGVPLPTFNIFQPLTPHGLTDELLADTAAYFASKNALYAIEFIHDRLRHAPDYLDQRRYQPLPPQPAMFARNFRVRNDLPRPEIYVERVQTVPALTAFCTLQHRVFDFPLADVVKFFPVAHLNTQTRQVIRHYLAFVDEEPAGAGTAICLDDVVSLWNVCTADAYRERGVGVTLVYQMLTDALDLRCNLAMLYATPQAYHLFSKLGFEIYTQRQWFLPPGLDYVD
jgi:hypothetical protein